MQIIDFVVLANVLLERHELSAWRIDLDNARRRLGVCRHSKRLITISRKFVLMNESEAVRETILHEIAHALAGPRAGHGPKWRMVARSIGGDGRRTADPRKLNLVPPCYEGKCPACAYTLKRFKRFRAACAKCCRGVFQKEFLFIWSRIKTV